MILEVLFVTIPIAQQGCAGKRPSFRLHAQRLSAHRMADTITWDDFERVDIRVGTVIQAEPYPEARKPAIKLWVDFGDAIGVRKTSAQLTVHYTPEALIGRQVAAVVNFPPRQIGKFMSEILVLGMPDAEGAVVLLAPDLTVPNGGRMF
jgi:tRNA-binding protein